MVMTAECQIINASAFMFSVGSSPVEIEMLCTAHIWIITCVHLIVRKGNWR